MRRYSWKRAAKKKKFCAALMISLLLGGACFLPGEAASAEPAGDGSPSGTERSEENIEDAGLEAVEPKNSAAKPSENEMPDSDISEADTTDSERTEDKDTKEPETGAADPEASGIEPPGSDTPKSDLSGKENSNSEDSGTEADDTEPKPSAAEPSETDAPKSETSNQKEPETQQPAGTEPENTGSETPDTASPQADPSAEQLPGLTCLQIPEKLEIVIDPWEIDGKTQIYSEPFVVKNTGDAPGVLTLSFTCKVNEEGGVSVRKTREGLHDSEEKQLYIKAILGNEEEVVFTEEGAQCQTELLPGEELSLWFEGEVNENAEEPWIDGDLEIEGKYSWEEGEILSEENTETGKEADREETQPSVSENGTDVSTIETEKESVEKKTPSAEQTQETAEEETSPAEPKKEPAGEAVPPVQTEGEAAGERDPAAEPEKAPSGKTDSSAEPEPDSAEEAVPPAGTEQESDQDPNTADEAPGESPEDHGLSESGPEEE